MACLRPLSNGDLLLTLYVQPRASRNELAGRHGEALKLRLTTPPVDGKANKAVLAYLAKLLKLPKSALTIKSGQQSRTKTIVIQGAEAAKIRHLLGLEV